MGCTQSTERKADAPAQQPAQQPAEQAKETHQERSAPVEPAAAAPEPAPVEQTPAPVEPTPAPVEAAPADQAAEPEKAAEAAPAQDPTPEPTPAPVAEQQPEAAPVAEAAAPVPVAAAAANAKKSPAKKSPAKSPKKSPGKKTGNKTAVPPLALNDENAKRHAKADQEPRGNAVPLKARGLGNGNVNGASSAPAERKVCFDSVPAPKDHKAERKQKARKAAGRHAGNVNEDLFLASIAAFERQLTHRNSLETQLNSR